MIKKIMTFTPVFGLTLRILEYKKEANIINLASRFQ